MSKNQLAYFCSNPECRNKFTLDEAERKETLAQLSDIGIGKEHTLTVPLLHILCPKCKTIATSIHLPPEVL